MKVYLVPCDTTGCGMYRMFYPKEALSRAPDLDIEIVGERLEREDETVVVFQRPTEAEIAAETIPYLQSKGYAVAVEIDDNLSRLDPKHLGFWYYHPKRNPQSNWRHLEAACAQADMVICTTDALAQQYGGHGRVSVIPNYIPERHVVDAVRTDVGIDGTRRVGWAGQVATHPGDIDVAARGIRAVARRSNWRFSTIGFVDTLAAVGLQEGPDAEFQPWVPMTAYHQTLQRFDIGIVPLALTHFNEAKSWLKGLEYAAAGVPFVASPTGPYRALHELGAGVLAEGQKDWQRALTKLADDDSWRQEVAEVGLSVAREMTVERNAWRWLEAWHTAVRNYRSRPLSAAAQQMQDNDWRDVPLAFH